MMPRAACEQPNALSCAVRLLAVSRSDRQYGCKLRREKNSRAVRGQKYENIYINEEYSTTCVIIPVLPYIRNKAQRRTTQYCSVGHGTAPLGSARLRTVLHYAAAELVSIYSWTDQSWASIVIQHRRSTWYVQTRYNIRLCYILEPGIRQFQEFESPRVHTRINSWCFARAQVDFRKAREHEVATLYEKWTSTGIAEPCARSKLKATTGGEKGRHLAVTWPEDGK